MAVYQLIYSRTSEPNIQKYAYVNGADVSDAETKLKAADSEAVSKIVQQIENAIVVV